MFYVYRYTSQTSGKMYIGFTSDFKERQNQHRRNAFNKQQDYKFYRALRKYGLEDFVIDILFVGFDAEYTLNTAEVQLIESYNSYKNGYNSTLGGDAPMLGKKHSQETIDEMSRTRSGENSPRWRKKHIQKTKDKISAANSGNSYRKGTTTSQKGKDNMSKAAKGRGKGSTNNNAKTFWFISPLNEVTEVTKVTGALRQFCDDKNISKNCIRKYIDKGVVPLGTKPGPTKRNNTAGWEVRSTQP
ncbi:nuclease associated modular domain 3 protein [Vibrio phage 2.275.O._10N.286.54.E11]|nr:nuclease associated modular domain 3 protein [Vibrio phage 2.275.O._10N.286.54.E11]